MVLVTGAAGFIGSHVSTHLLEEGHAVVGIDDLNDHYDSTLKEWRLKQLDSKNGFEFHRADITDRGTVKQLFEDHDIDAVYNLAAHAGVRDSLLEPEAYLHVNAHGTLQLLELCRRYDVGTFLLASTSSLYGHHNEVPFTEDADTGIPPSPYAASKKAAEALAATYNELYEISTPVCRYFTVYGPAGRPDMSVFRFIRWVAEGEPITIYGDGTQRRDFTYVRDIARGTRLAAEEIDDHDIVNLGSDDPVQLRDLISVIEDTVGRDAELTFTDRHPADMDATWASIDTARQQLGWEPEVSLSDGIRRTADWYETEREWASKIDLGSV